MCTHRVLRNTTAPIFNSFTRRVGVRWHAAGSGWLAALLGKRGAPVVRAYFGFNDGLKHVALQFRLPND